MKLRKAPPTCRRAHRTRALLFAGRPQLPRLTARRDPTHTTLCAQVSVSSRGTLGKAYHVSDAAVDSLASTLALAMATRRGKLAGAADDEDTADDDDDDEWSD